ncbi:MAG: AGE family epimerase/isomerase [Caulobacter sp.]|nr:AGE family epimerase/isomerase [Caulobacter sp.]
MSRPDDRARASAGYRRLKAWLVEAAAPLWSSVGVDGRGAFHETVGQDGVPIEGPRRARVQPRQLYALQVARDLGAAVGPSLLRRGLDTYLAAYIRPDGLVRAVVDGEGEALDDHVVLYDQTFPILALACLKGDLGDEAQARATDFRAAIIRWLGRSDGGFETGLEPGPLLASNPHMHLLEACLAWVEAGGDAEWGRLAEGIVALALDRFIDPVSGALREFFDSEWRPAPGEAGRIVEPGHQFEWAWLLLRWSRLAPRHPRAVAARNAALRLIANGEDHGVDPARGVAFNSLLDDWSIQDAEARLWPQTERIKAWALAAAQADAPWKAVADAVEGLELYLATPIRGLWFDRMTPDGRLIDAPAPASSFYHIVCAIAALGEALGEERTACEA